MSVSEGCKKQIWKGFRFHPCGRRVVGEHGFCGIHSPEAVAKREAKSRAKWEAKREEWRAMYKRKEAERHALDVELPALRSEVAALREALHSLARIETDDDGLPVLVISCGWHCQTNDQTELPLVWAALSRPALTGNGGKP